MGNQIMVLKLYIAHVLLSPTTSVYFSMRGRRPETVLEVSSARARWFNNSWINKYLPRNSAPYIDLAV